MDQALSSFNFKKPPVAGETSRCARCVKDKKGCDRRFPCARCIESGYPGLCVYTGMIPQTRWRHGAGGDTLSISTTLHGRSSHSDGDIGYEEDGRTPAGVRKRRLDRTPTPQAHAHRGRGFHRKRQSFKPIRQADEDWFNLPPQMVETVVQVDPEKSEDELARLQTYGAYTDIVVYLPIELYRSTGFVRMLDNSYRTKSEELDRVSKELQKTRDGVEARKLRHRLVLLMNQSMEDRHESIAEIAKLQTLVDSHISVIRSGIEKIEDPTSALPIIKETEEHKKTGPTTARKRGRPRKVDAEPHITGDIPIADEEPVYCYCHRVSFGKMIACENEQCEGGEWFHFECLGLANAPRGKWWCETCTEAGLAKKISVQRVNEAAQKATVRGESKAERRARIREENKLREAARRSKLRARRLRD